MDTQAYAALAQRLTEGAARALTGKEKETRLLLCALAAGGHVLLEDVPGTGKTALARALAQLMGLQFCRIQGTPDLLPSDLTGINFYNQKTGEFEFRRGPLFSNIILADEISPDTCRYWDMKTHDHLDKDRFRRDLGDAEGAYQEVYRRLGLDK